MRNIIFIILPLLTSAIFTACSINGEKVNFNVNIKRAVQNDNNNSIIKKEKE